MKSKNGKTQQHITFKKHSSSPISWQIVVPIHYWNFSLVTIVRNFLPCQLGPIVHHGFPLQLKHLMTFPRQASMIFKAWWYSSSFFTFLAFLWSNVKEPEDFVFFGGGNDWRTRPRHPRVNGWRLKPKEWLVCTRPETNKSHLEMDGWNTISLPFWGPGLFSGAWQAVSFRKGRWFSFSFTGVFSGEPAVIRGFRCKGCSRGGFRFKCRTYLYRKKYDWNCGGLHPGSLT